MCVRVTNPKQCYFEMLCTIFAAFDEKQKLKRAEINNRPLFGPSGLESTPASSSTSSSTSSGQSQCLQQNKQQQLLEARKRMGLTPGRQPVQGFGSPVTSSRSLTANSLGIVQKRSHGKSQDQGDSVIMKTIAQNVNIKSEDTSPQISACKSGSDDRQQSTVKANRDSCTALGSLVSSYDHSSSSDSD